MTKSRSNLSSLSSELIFLKKKLDEQVESFKIDKYQKPLDRLNESSNLVSKSWSGSWMGYHSRVYYKEFQPPPSGAHFSSEWGLYDNMGYGTRGYWKEYDFDDVQEVIKRNANFSDFKEYKEISKSIKKTFENIQP